MLVEREKACGSWLCGGNSPVSTGRHRGNPVHTFCEARSAGQVGQGVAGGIYSQGGRKPAGANNFSPRAGVDCTLQGLRGLYPRAGSWGWPGGAGGPWSVDPACLCLLFPSPLTRFLACSSSVSLFLFCVSSRSRCPALRTSPSNCFSQQLPLPSLHTARRSWNDHNSIGVLKALIGAVSRVWGPIGRRCASSSSSSSSSSAVSAQQFTSRPLASPGCKRWASACLSANFANGRRTW